MICFTLENCLDRLLNLDDRRRRFPTTFDELTHQVTDARSKKAVDALDAVLQIADCCLQFGYLFLQHGDSFSIRALWLKLRGLIREVCKRVMLLGLYVRYLLLKSSHHLNLLFVEVLLQP